MPEIRVLKVREWAKNFENNRTREMKIMGWVPVPVKLDGDGYTELLDHPDGAAHFGAWVALLEVAARCEIRGTFLRQSRTELRRPHDIAALSRVTRIPVSLLAEAINRLVNIGWLEWETFVCHDLQETDGDPASSCGDPASSCGKPAASRAGAVWNRTEGNRTEREEGECAGAHDTPEKPTGNGKPPKFDPRTVPLPPILDTPEFREKWDLRLQERAEPGRTGAKPSESSIRAQLGKLEQLAKLRGVPAAIACVERATDGRHQGIVFPEDFEAPRNGSAGGLPSQQPGLTHDQIRRRSGAPPDWKEQLREREKDIVPWSWRDAQKQKEQAGE